MVGRLNTSLDAFLSLITINLNVDDFTHSKLFGLFNLDTFVFLSVEHDLNLGDLGFFANLALEELGASLFLLLTGYKRV